MAKLDWNKSIDGKYKLSIDVEYELKGTAMDVIVNLPTKEIKKRTKRIQQLKKLLMKMKKEGWQIEDVQIN